MHQPASLARGWASGPRSHGKNDKQINRPAKGNTATPEQVSIVQETVQAAALINLESPAVQVRTSH